MFAIECESADDEDVWGCLHLANPMCDPNLELLKE